MPRGATKSAKASNAASKASQSSSTNIEQTLAQRAQRRAAHKKRKEDKIEELKNEGNRLFKEGDYEGAANVYVEAIEKHGAKALLMSNLAAAYLKLEWYDLAEIVATKALQYEPQMIKARYRRGMARKGLENLKAALVDFETIRMQDLTCREAAEQEDIIRAQILAYNDYEDDWEDDDGESFDDYYWPDYDDDPELYSSSDESGSSDCEHTGNGFPCRFYNHEGCSKGNICRYSHAPDNKSVRDKLGKNVCIYFLLDDMCKFGPKCVYSHVKTHLPHGWWDHGELVEAAMGELLLRNMQDQFGEMELYNFIQRIAQEHSAIQPLGHGGGRAGKPKAIIPSERFVMLLSLEDGDFSNTYNKFLAAFRPKAILVKITSADVALQHLASSHIVGVFVADPAITKRKYASLLAKIVEYVKAGGSVVVGESFSSCVKSTDLEKFFQRSWGLSWKGGSYHRTTFALNKSHPLAKNNPSLPPSFSMKALHVKDITPDVAVYKPTEDSKLQSMVWGPEKITDLSESPVAHAQIGKGYFGYIGDVNSEEAAVNVIVAMFGLLDAPYPSQKSTSTPTQGGNNPASPADTKTKANSKAESSSGIKANPLGTQGKGVLKADSTKSGPSATTVPGNEPKSKSPNSFILVLSLENEDFFASMHEHLLSNLRKKMEWKQGLTPSSALTMLTSPDLAGVIITDPGVVRPKHKHVVQKLVEYVKSGGSAVVGGLFSSFATGSDINNFFSAVWGLSWRTGSYHRTTFARNSTHKMVKNNPSLASSYNVKALHLGGIATAHPVYLSTIEAKVQSSVFTPEPITEHSESPVVQAQIGKGYLGYVGDVNGEEDSTNIVLAMLGLLDPPSPSDGLAHTVAEEVKAPKVPPKKTSRPFLMVLSSDGGNTFSKVQNDLLSKLRSKLEVLHGLSNERVIDLMASSDLVGIFITDATIADSKNAYLLARLVEYTKSGGTVVIGGTFSSFIKRDEISVFFGDAWGLPWTAGDYTSINLTLNGRHHLISKNPSLPSSFAVKALHISGIKPSMAVYIASKQSHIYVPPAEVTQAAIIHAKIGEGYLGYIGDVGIEGSTKIVLAMFNIN